MRWVFYREGIDHRSFASNFENGIEGLTDDLVSSENVRLYRAGVAVCVSPPRHVANHAVHGDFAIVLAKPSRDQVDFFSDACSVLDFRRHCLVNPCPAVVYSLASPCKVPVTKTARSFFHAAGRLSCNAQDPVALVSSS